MRSDYDIIVIGAGSGGLNMAGFMNRIGLKVLLIDKSDASIGGDCLNTGCVPSKALIHVARMAKKAKETQRFGISTSGTIDLKKAMEYVREKQAVFREHESAAWFRSLGMDVALGAATFTGPRSVSVAGKEYSAKRIVLATGSRPRKLSVPGIDKVNILTNENLFEHNTLPKRLAIIGGGPIGIEMAQTFQRLGSQVTVIEYGPKFLPREAPEIAKVLLQQLKNEGVQFYFNARIQEFPTSNTLLFNDENAKSVTLNFDEVLVSIGRELNIQNLDLEKANIRTNEQGTKILVNEYLRTTNKHVYACGDVVGSYQFTHAAEIHASVLIHNFFSPLKKKVNYDHISWVTYTSPEIATFGLNEQQLKERRINYERIEHDFIEDDRAIVNEYQEGKMILYVSKGKILGGTMIAEHAGELIQELTLAMSAGIPMKKLFSKNYAYPTASRVNKRAIGLFFAKKLTPFVKKVFKLLY